MAAQPTRKKSRSNSAIAIETTKATQQGNTDFDLDEHLLSLEQCYEKHKVSIENGLTTSEAKALEDIHGLNLLQPPPVTPWYVMFFHHLTGFFSLLLWFAAILCFFAYALKSDDQSNLYLGVVLTIVVMLTGCFSFYQDAKSAAVMEGFKNFLPEYCTVVRNNGKQEDIEAKFLVPGDVVLIKSGQKIPADLRVCEFSNFKVDNSSLTGESEPQKRGIDNEEDNPLEATNLAFFGTLCVSGTCTGLVVKTGDNTIIGRIANLASSTGSVKTPIAIEIEHFIHIVSCVAVFLGVSFLVIGFVIGVDPVSNLVFAIGIIVANVPEGLLATVTVSLTLTAKRMAAKNVLVKNLEAVETLGSTTVIASDKTGTLTQNRMTVAHLWYDCKTFLAHGEGGEAAFNRNHVSFRHLQRIATLCNTATFKTDAENEAKNVLEKATNGDASESAFIKFCQPIDDIMQMRAQNKMIDTIPFNSANKFQVSINLDQNDAKRDRLMLMKGAPERIMQRCSHVLIEGKSVPITPEIQQNYSNSLKSFMFGGERVLGFCEAMLPAADFPYPDFEYETDPEKANFPLQGLTFVGLISLIDPPRSAVPRAVACCQRAGIKVIMVTGDHPDTAEAIAKQVGIIRGKTIRDIANEEGKDEKDVDPLDERIQAVVITGSQLQQLTDDEIQDYLDYDQIVFARTSPKQKLIIVKGLQAKTEIKRGLPSGESKAVHHVVAVTGDGVNDSPALKAADIGVAMGIVGSDVAKEAADMILLDDDFSSIVNGVEEGRLIFDNLKKSIAYTLSSNIPEISPFLVFIITQIPLPLPTVLILCIDLGTDMVPAISLAYENKEDNIMEKPPRDAAKDRLVTAKMISFSYLQIGIVQAAAGFYTYIVVLNDYGFHPTTLPGLSVPFDDGYVKCPGSDLTIAAHDNFPCPGNNIPSLWYDGKVAATLHRCNIDRSGVCWNPAEALAHAQAAFFISIIVVQWSDIIACKTRWLSLKQQGMRNGFLNFGLFFETTLGMALCYITPLNVPLGTRDLSFVHWLPAIPFAIMITSYDETRKWLMRNLGKNNWVERNTFY